MKRTLKDVKAHINLMKKEGVLTLKVEGLELELAPFAFTKDEKEPQPEQQTQIFEAPSEEEILFWSSPGIGEAN